jgi:hypothetical protein
MFLEAKARKDIHPRNQDIQQPGNSLEYNYLKRIKNAKNIEI